MGSWRERRMLRRAAPAVPAEIRVADVAPGIDLDDDGEDDLRVAWVDDDPAPEQPAGSPGQPGAGVGNGLVPAGSVRAIPPRPVREREPDGEPAVRPVLPEGWPDRLREEARFALRRIAYHAVRVVFLVYLGRAARHSPRGLARLGAGLARALTDYEGAPARQNAAAGGRGAEYLALKYDRDRTVKRRLFWTFAVALPIVAVVLGAALFSVLHAPTLGGRLLGLAVMVAVVAGLGWVGQPEDEPIIPRAKTALLAVPELTNERIREAFHDADLPKRPSPSVLAKIAAGQIASTNARGITFQSDPARVGPGRGTGYEFTVDLPPGIAAEVALRRQDRIASGLGVARSQLHLALVPESARRVNVYVADQDPWAGRAPTTPLAEATQVNFWEAQPFGVDVRGFAVKIRMIWTNLLVAAIPRMGKSFAAVNIALAAALDWRVRLIVLNGKRGIWSLFAPICHRYVAGARDDAAEYVHRVLLEIRADVERRTELIEDLDAAEVPEGKLTPEIASDPGNDCPLTLVVIDEAHRFMLHPVWGKPITALLEEIVEISPSSGYMLVLCIQRPTHQTISTRLRGAMGLRFVLRMMDDDGAKAALGKIIAGLNPVQLKKAHKGVGLLDGSEDEEASLEEQPEAQFVRTYWVDLPLVKVIVKRGHALRASKGRLTGYAADDDLRDEDTPFLLLDHLMEEIGVGEEEVWSETLIERISRSHPNLYDGWSPRDLAQHLKKFGVPTHQINRRVEVEENGETVVRQVNRRGVKVAELAAGYDHEMERRARGAAATA